MQIKNAANGLTIFQYTFNLCNIQKERKRGNVWAIQIFGIIEKSANFNTTCPFEKGIRTYNQITIPDVLAVPFIKLGETWQIISNLQYKEKKMMSIWVITVDFIVIEIED